MNRSTEYVYGTIRHINPNKHIPYMNIEAIDKTCTKTDNYIDKKSELGQFMTPSNIANFMSSMFTHTNTPIKILDCGAGAGALSIAAVKTILNISSLEAWEIDRTIKNSLKTNLDSLSVEYIIHHSDFIQDAVSNIINNKGTRFSHAILNPPYKKIKSDSLHRQLLSSVGIETVNLYTAFLALTILLMENMGQIVAIIPRSFCNGPYYKPFRKLMLDECSIELIHIFESRNQLFKDDNVLQENIIIKLVKAKKQGPVQISISHDQNLQDYTVETYPFSHIINAKDEENFIHIPTEKSPKLSRIHSEIFKHRLESLNLSVSTGPVVDFRLKDYWLQDPDKNSVPLIYPHHFTNGIICHPKNHKKPNALQKNDVVSKWLMPNGVYVLVKRFTSKEEKKRVVAYVFDKDTFESDVIGFENHWNVFHFKKNGITKIIANGLACFLNSTLLDKHFRVFSGHTQVNATDLKNLLYPDINFLKKIGKSYKPTMTQEQIDNVALKKLKFKLIEVLKPDVHLNSGQEHYIINW